MGSAILEAAIPAADVNIVGESPDITEIGGFVQGYSPEILGETEGFYSSDSLGSQSEPPTAPGQTATYPQSQSAGIGGVSLDATAPFTPHTWPSRAKGIPSSPGAAILEEFDAIHEKYERRVYRQCFRMLRNQEDAEDLTQEVFLQLFRKAHTFRGEANFSTWLHRLTVNTVLMRMRRYRRWRDVLTSMDATPGLGQDDGGILALVKSLPAPPTSTVDKISLDVAIAQLSSGYKEVFLLHDSEGYRHDEIAKMLGISEGTSKSQLHKARFRLRELIDSSNTGSSGTRLQGVVPGKRKNGRSSSHAGKFASKASYREIPGGGLRDCSKERDRRPAAA